MASLTKDSKSHTPSVSHLAAGRTPSLAARAFLAVVLLVGFYLLATVVIVILLYIPYAEWTLAQRVHPQILIFCLGGAFVILVSLIPRPDRFTAPGPRLDEGEQPRLFLALTEIARRTGQEMPLEVYLVPDVNAWVSQRGGTMGFGSRRVMGLGLPLLQILTVSQLEAVLAHEFGHYYGGDTKLGPWIYRTRATMRRTLSGLAHSRHGGLLQKPFLLYWRMFLRVTHSLSRRQEYVADNLAARTVGKRALADGLRAIHAAAPAFDAYWTHEVVPVLSNGGRPPLAEGFNLFMNAEEVANAISHRLKVEATEGKSDPYDTHPSLAERLAAMAGLPDGNTPDNDPPAISLLANVPDLESQILASIAGEAKAANLQPVSWEAAGVNVYLPAWRKQVRENANIMKGITPMALPDIARDLPRFGVMVASPKRDAGILRDVEELNALAINTLGAGLAVALYECGWELTALPGSAVCAEREGQELLPFDAIHDLGTGRLTPDSWRALCRDAGIGSLDLGSVD